MEGGMQQNPKEAGPASQAPAQGPRRLALAEHMRMLAAAHTNATRGTLLQCADEIERLQGVIDDYVRICEASSREIEMLKAAVAKANIVVVGPGQAGTDE